MRVWRRQRIVRSTLADIECEENGMERFVGKSVVVTGAGSGFGEAIAKRFARKARP